MSLIMKFNLITNILKLACLGMIFPGFVHASSLSTINGFNLKTCVAQLCLDLRADKAQSGQLSLLHTLKNYKASFIENGKIQEFVGEFGYIDFEKNTVVLKNKSQGEIFINLNTLKKEEFK